MDWKTAHQAWEELRSYRFNVYDSYSAMYSGDHDKLRMTGDRGSFWSRSGSKAKVHVPIFSDIASVSANLLFGAEPKFTIFHGDKEQTEELSQKRFEDIAEYNGLAYKLTEAAETCAALGDVFMKIRWNSKVPYPLIDVVQADSCWAEYVLGEMQCLHTFSEVTVNSERNEYIRMYERYTKGAIHMEMYRGDADSLGSMLEESKLNELGYESDVKCPIDEMMAIHIANMRPNRDFRYSMLGRSDFAGLRDLGDALDETWSSWIRDIRLAKAKLIVPVDYLRRKPQEMLDGVASSGSWEFDPDIETYVAMDIHNESGAANPITPSQFSIRATEHSMTVMTLIENILQFAGYSPQSFGLAVNGAASGTALNIRERKSAITRNKKQQYWVSPLQLLLTRMVNLDAILYPNGGSHTEDYVMMSFSDDQGYDSSMVAATMTALYNAQSASTITRVRTLHPDWDEQQIADEVTRLTREFAINTEEAIEIFGEQQQNEEEPTE